MTARQWRTKITEKCKAVGTYRDSFQPVILTLSDILAQRDAAYEEFIENGGEPCIEKVSDRGARNITKNPRLQIWIDLNTLALSYWRDLGLTPAGLKKIDEQAMKPKKVSALAEALKDLG